MRRAKKATKNDSVQARALVNRQVKAWEKHDFAIAAADWLPNGELFSPGGRVLKKDMQRAMRDYFKNFTDLEITVNDMFLSPRTEPGWLSSGIGPSLARETAKV